MHGLVVEGHIFIYYHCKILWKRNHFVQILWSKILPQEPICSKFCTQVQYKETSMERDIKMQTLWLFVGKRWDIWRNTCNFTNGVVIEFSEVKFHVVGAGIIKPLKIRKIISLEQRHKGTLKQKIRVPFCRSWLEETGFVWLIGSLALVIDQWSSVT